MACLARVRVTTILKLQGGHHGSCYPPTPRPPSRTTPPTPRPRPRPAVQRTAPPRPGRTGHPPGERPLPRSPLLAAAHPLGLPLPSPRPRPLLPSRRRTLARLAHRPGIGTLLRRYRGLLQGTPPIARGGAGTPDAGHRPKHAGASSAPLALEWLYLESRRWHHAVHAGYAGQSESLPPTQRPKAGYRLPHPPPGGAVLPGRGHGPGRRLGTLSGQAQRRDRPVARPARRPASGRLGAGRPLFQLVLGIGAGTPTGRPPRQPSAPMSPRRLPHRPSPGARGSCRPMVQAGAAGVDGRANLCRLAGVAGRA